MFTLRGTCQNARNPFFKSNYGPARGAWPVQIGTLTCQNEQGRKARRTKGHVRFGARWDDWFATRGGGRRVRGSRGWGGQFRPPENGIRAQKKEDSGPLREVRESDSKAPARCVLVCVGMIGLPPGGGDAVVAALGGAAPKLGICC